MNGSCNEEGGSIMEHISSIMARVIARLPRVAPLKIKATLKSVTHGRRPR